MDENPYLKAPPQFWPVEKLRRQRNRLQGIYDIWPRYHDDMAEWEKVTKDFCATEIKVVEEAIRHKNGVRRAGLMHKFFMSIPLPNKER
jgi:hypothetical protein